MSTCIKCRNANHYEIKENKLFKRCRVCDFTELAKKDEYRIEYEDFTQKGEMYLQSLRDSVEDITTPTIIKDGVKYTIHVEPQTMRRKYVSHKDGKIYTNIE
jgi:hypothetical protein